jgi:hypothetical protein
VNASIVRGLGTLRPRMCSATSRAFRAAQCTHCAWARTVCFSGSATRHLRFTSRLAVAGWPRNVPRRRELAELVADHLLGDEHRHVLAAVVDGDRVPDHLGKIVEVRDQVRTIRLLPDVFISSIRFIRRSSTKGPSWTICSSLPLVLARGGGRGRSTCRFLVLERVRLPSVGTPHGVTGCRPPFDLPSPPPCGWSTGFIAEPRTDGTLALPAAAARLAAGLVLVVGVPDLTDGGATG